MASDGTPADHLRAAADDLSDAQTSISRALCAADPERHPPRVLSYLDSLAGHLRKLLTQVASDMEADDG